MPSIAASALGDRRRHRERRGRDLVAREELLAEHLAALEPRAIGAGPERRRTGRAQLIGEPGDQRRLGADDDQIDRALGGELTSRA